MGFPAELPEMEESIAEGLLWSLIKHFNLFSPMPAYFNVIANKDMRGAHV